jgi:magnesium chelatase family protein
MARRRYFGRLSGPLLDRVDLQIDVLPVRRGADGRGESTEVVAARVREARERAAVRLGPLGFAVNAQVPGSWLRENTPRPAMQDVIAAVDKGKLTARGLDRVLRVAWTLADIEGVSVPSGDAVLQAMTLRSRGAAA